MVALWRWRLVELRERERLYSAEHSQALNRVLSALSNFKNGLFELRPSKIQNAAAK